MNVYTIAENYVKLNYPNIVGDDLIAIKEAYIDGFNAARHIYIPIHHKNNCFFIDEEI